MEFRDTIVFDAPRKTNDGYLVAEAPVARTGIQIYSGREVDPDNSHGMRDKAEVRVYRDPAEVFSRDSLASYAHRPITIDHPPEAVTADNWRDYAVGQVGGEIRHDEKLVYVPMVIMDADAIRSVERGKREISQGYSCTLDWSSGTNAAGEMFDCQQRTIRANHTAIVGFARGGHELKIGDTAVNKTISLGDHSVEVSDAAAILFDTLKAKLATSDAALTKAAADLSAANTQVAVLTTQNTTKDAEIVTLKQAVADSAITPAKLRAASKSYGDTVTIANKIVAVGITDAMDEPAIKKSVVLAKLGDKAKDWNDTLISASFDALAATITEPGQTSATGVDTLRDGLRATPAVTGDAVAEAVKARNARFSRFENAHLGSTEKAN